MVVAVGNPHELGTAVWLLPLLGTLVGGVLFVIGAKIAGHPPGHGVFLDAAVIELLFEAIVVVPHQILLIVVHGRGANVLAPELGPAAAFGRAENIGVL